MTYAQQPPIGQSDWTISQIHELFDLAMADEILKSLIGYRIGRGVSREVFEMSHNPDLVLKIENMSKGWFANIAEYQTWNSVKGTPYERWFAPVHSLTVGGLMLVQSKTKPPAVRDLPAEIPAVFSDVGMKNFGMFEGRLVCHDYALMQNRFWLNPKQKMKMQKAFWS